MAPKQQPGAAPQWQRSSAERMEAYGLARRQAELPPAPPAPAAPNYVPAVANCGGSASSTGTQPARAPSNPSEELESLRLAGVVASSFNPARHAVMVAGRPVVAVLKQTIAGCFILCRG
jgi:hypothetical protein